MRDRHRPAGGVDPFVHAPEMGLADVQVQLVDQPGHQRQLLGRADRTADAGRIVVGRAAPGVDIFQRLGQIEIFERVVHHHAEAGPAQARQVLGRQPGGVVENLGVQRRVVPPAGGNLADRSAHGCRSPLLWCRRPACTKYCRRDACTTKMDTHFVVRHYVGNNSASRSFADRRGRDAGRTPRRRPGPPGGRASRRAAAWRRDIHPCRDGRGATPAGFRGRPAFWTSIELPADVHQRGRLDRPAQRVDALQRIAIVEMRHAGAFPQRQVVIFGAE